MLIEIWERLRGYDKWIQTEAQIAPTEEIRKALGKRYRTSPSARTSGDLLLWHDQHGQAQYGVFVTHDTSPLYQLLEGETISIRYDPTRPDRYYCRALWIGWASWIAKSALFVAAAGGFIVWRFWEIIKNHGF